MTLITAHFEFLCFNFILKFVFAIKFVAQCEILLRKRLHTESRELWGSDLCKWQRERLRFDENLWMARSWRTLTSCPASRLGCCCCYSCCCSGRPDAPPVVCDVSSIFDEPFNAANRIALSRREHGRNDSRWWNQVTETPKARNVERPRRPAFLIRQCRSEFADRWLASFPSLVTHV